MLVNIAHDKIVLTEKMPSKRETERIANEPSRISKNAQQGPDSK